MTTTNKMNFFETFGELIEKKDNKKKELRKISEENKNLKTRLKELSIKYNTNDANLECLTHNPNMEEEELIELLKIKLTINKNLHNKNRLVNFIEKYLQFYRLFEEVVNNNSIADDWDGHNDAEYHDMFF